MEMNHNSQSDAPRSRHLFECIGGTAGVSALVERFYGYVLDDPQLAPFFKNSSMDRLRQMQIEFFTAALDGPVKFGADAIAHAHQSRGITLPHFQMFAQHLINCLSDCNLSYEEHYGIVQRISMYVNEVTGAPGGT